MTSSSSRKSQRLPVALAVLLALVCSVGVYAGGFGSAQGQISSLAGTSGYVLTGNGAGVPATFQANAAGGESLAATLAIGASTSAHNITLTSGDSFLVDTSGRIIHADGTITVGGTDGGSGVAGKDLYLRGGKGNAIASSGALFWAQGGDAAGQGGEALVQAGVGTTGQAGGSAVLSGGTGNVSGENPTTITAGGGGSVGEGGTSVVYGGDGKASQAGGPVILAGGTGNHGASSPAAITISGGTAGTTPGGVAIQADTAVTGSLSVSATLTTVGLATTGNTALGNGASDTVTITGPISVNGSVGTADYYLASGGAGTVTQWKVLPAGGGESLAATLAIGADGNAVSLTNMGSYTAAAGKTITIATGTFATAVNSNGTTTLGDATSDHCTITGDLAVSGGGVGTAGQILSSGGASAAMVWTGSTVGQAGVGTGGVVAVSGSLTIDSSYAGKIIDCSGGTATITVTLPTCSAGAGPFTIVDMDASRMVHVLSNSGDNIYAGGVVSATAGYWSSGGGSSTVANVGYHLTVVGLDATSWLVISGDGLWSKDGD